MQPSQLEICPEIFSANTPWQYLLVLRRASETQIRNSCRMLDYFCIFSKGGALLWTWQLTALRGSPVEVLIRTCLLEERSGEQSFTYKPPVGSSYTLKWSLDNVRSRWLLPRSLTSWIDLRRFLSQATNGLPNEDLCIKK